MQLLMITLRSRKYGDGKQLMLSVRIKQKGRDNAVALGISVDSLRWQLIEQSIKQAREAYKRGATIFIDDALTSKLWNLVKELSVREKAGTLDDATISNTIRAILHQDEVTEISRAKERKQEAIKHSNTTLVQFVEQFIRECESGERLKHKSQQRIKETTLKNYRACLSNLRKYEHDRKRTIVWDDITLDLYADMTRYFVERNLSPNSIAGFHNCLKVFLYAARDLHLTTRDDFISHKWSIDYEQVDNIYIPESRLKEMAAIDFNDADDLMQRLKRYAKDKEEYDTLLPCIKRRHYRKRLSEARDLFLLGCLTGQRVSDYKRVSDDMIETIIGTRKFLHLRQEKTNKDVYVPYSDTIRDILSRYNGEMPKVNIQIFGNRIKVIGLLCGWVESAGLQEHKGLLQYPSTKRFCDAIKTHTARRTFATNAYKNGVPLSAIMAVTGHSSEDMLRRYLKLGSKERALLAAVEFDKVKTAL